MACLVLPDGPSGALPRVDSAAPRGLAFALDETLNAARLAFIKR